jgi:hypothetical protein
MDKNENSRISNNPSHIKIKKRMEEIKNYLELAANFGIDTIKLSEEYSNLEKMSKMLINIPDQFNDHFRNSGWIAYETMNHDIMIKAVKLADADKFEDAENLLVEYYDEKLIKLFISRLNWIENFKPRMDLIELAFEDYLEGRFHASIPVILAMIDGVVTDLKSGDQRGFFAEGTKVEAWDAIAAHETGLPALQRVLSKTRKKTRREKISLPYRNGILHGRDLGYANKIVAVKIWATLFALSDGIMAIKKDETPQEEIEYSIIDSIIEEKKSEKEFLDTMTKINSFEPRKLNLSYVHSLDYDEETPEKFLVDFLDLWSKNKPNFYEMTKKLDLFLEKRSIKQMIGVLRNKIFKNQKLNGYKILSINDETIGIASINVNLNIQDGEKEKSQKTTFKLCYYDPDGKISIRGTEGGSWKILSGFGLEDVIF